MNRCQTKHLNFLNISACIMTFLDVPHGCSYSTLMVYKLLFVYVSKFVLFVLLKLYVHVVQCVNICVQFGLYLYTAYVIMLVMFKLGVGLPWVKFSLKI